MSKQEFSFIDLFAGAGGLSEGLTEAGFQGLWANEIMPDYAQTYKTNHPATIVETADIKTLDPKRLLRESPIERGELDLMAGGPPCQGFSINAPFRTALDERNHLFKEYLRFVDAFAPKAVLIENVPGLVSFEGGQTLRAILDALAELGYGANIRVLGAAFYGAPQTRWRTFIIGLRGENVPDRAFPEPICRAPIRPNFTATFNGQSIVKMPSPEADSKFVTIFDALSDLPPLRNGEQGEPIKNYYREPSCAYQRRARRGSIGVFNHEAPRLADINIKRLQHIKPGGNWTDIPDALLPAGMKSARKSDHTKRYGRVDPAGLASLCRRCWPTR
jgi:DNA (cytosine-5)-methyltransferase 1